MKVFEVGTEVVYKCGKNKSIYRVISSDDDYTVILEYMTHNNKKVSNHQIREASVEEELIGRRK